MKLMSGLLVWRMAPFNTPEYWRWARVALEELKELSIRDQALNEIREQKTIETITANLKLGMIKKLI